MLTACYRNDYSDEFIVINTVVRIDSTDSMIVPVRDTAQRPGTPISGMMRFD
jgi:hypothetical protein